MQRWLKFQSQSKILNKRAIVVVFTVLVLFSINSQVYGEPNERIDISKSLNSDSLSFESDFAEVRQTDKLIFVIGKDTTVHVKHVIIGDTWGPTEPKVIKMIAGKHSNLQVTDEDGDYLRPMGFVGETFEDSEYVIAGQKTFRAYDLVVEYDLENFLEISDDGMWGKHIMFQHDVEIYIDDEIELIFANDRPVDIKGAGGINCMGCDIRIEFFDDEKPIVKKVIRNETKFEEISNTGEEFDLKFLSNGIINDLDYIKELNYFSFDVDKENQLFAITIPLDLLLPPYHVFLTDHDQEILVDSDQIRKTEYGKTDTHANLSFKSHKEGVIHVVGATEMEHEKLLTKLEDKMLAEKAMETDKSNSLTEAIKKQSEFSEQTIDDEAEDDSDEFYKNWGESQNNNKDNTIIFIIIGIIAVIIVGIIIKVKKN